MIKDERHICDLVMIVYYDEIKVFGVMNMQDISCWSTIWSGKNLETAIEIKKAYCAGYIDRKNEEKNYD